MIKKIIALVLCAVVLMSAFIPSVCVYAEEDNGSDDEFLGCVSFTCSYESKQRQIIIAGTVNHDFMIAHDDHTIRLYAVPPGAEPISVVNDSAAEPLAISPMTVKFTFYIAASGVVDRYSSYAVAITSPDGENHIAGAPLIPSVPSDARNVTGDKTGFKGLLTDDAHELGESGAGTVVVDVDLSRLEGDISGSILYLMNDTYIYVSRAYISNTDKKVMTSSAVGSSVYLRLLLNGAWFLDGIRSNGEIYSSGSLDRLYAISEFLAQRYDGGEYGGISGVILGSSIDSVDSEAVGDISIDEYAAAYSLYLVLVSGAIRGVDSTLDTVIPLSAKNTYYEGALTDLPVSPSILLEKIVARLNGSVSGALDCSVMLEAELAAACSGSASASDSAYIDADNIYLFTEYLEELRRRYSSVPSSVAYMWSVPAEISGNELCCSYIYSYMRLIGIPEVSSFTVAFDGNTSKNYKKLSRVLRYIDTSRGDEITRQYAEYLGKDSWSEVLGTDVALPRLKELWETPLALGAPNGVSGEFKYMDFSSPAALEHMYEGYNCTFLRSSYDKSGKRLLSVGTAAMQAGDGMDCLAVFEYPESYAYTPYMSLTLCIDGENAADAVYEVTLTVGDGRDRLAASGTVYGNSEEELWFDVSEFSAEHTAGYIKLSVRCLTDATDGFTVRLDNIKGYSTQYTSEELSTLIEEQRLKLRNSEAEEESGFDTTLIFTVIGAALAVIVVGIGLILVFRRDDESNNERR